MVRVSLFGLLLYCDCVIVLTAQLHIVCHVKKYFKDISFISSLTNSNLSLISLQDIGELEGCQKTKLSAGPTGNINAPFIMTPGDKFG